MKNTTVSWKVINKGQILACHKAAKKATFNKWFNTESVKVGKMTVTFGIGPDWNKYFCIH